MFASGKWRCQGVQGEWVSDGIGGGEWTTETRSKDDGQG